MTVERMRCCVCEAYDNSTWSYKVEKMSDNQVIAIYYRMLDKGYFHNEKNSRKGKQLKLF